LDEGSSRAGWDPELGGTTWEAGYRDRGRQGGLEAYHYRSHPRDCSRDGGLEAWANCSLVLTVLTVAANFPLLPIAVKNLTLIHSYCRYILFQNFWTAGLLEQKAEARGKNLMRAMKPMMKMAMRRTLLVVAMIQSLSGSARTMTQNQN